jgi:hypothetical protein
MDRYKSLASEFTVIYILIIINSIYYLDVLIFIHIKNLFFLISILK